MLMAGRLGDWGSHNIEHEISGIYDIAHGAGLAVVFPAWMRYVWRRKPERFVQFARRVFRVDYAPGQEEWAAEAGIARLEAFYRELGLPTRLAEAGIDGSRIQEMADNAMIGVEAVGMSFPLQAEDVRRILELAR